MACRSLPSRLRTTLEKRGCYHDCKEDKGHEPTIHRKAIYAMCRSYLKLGCSGGDKDFAILAIAPLEVEEGNVSVIVEKYENDKDMGTREIEIKDTKASQ